MVVLVPPIPPGPPRTMRAMETWTWVRDGLRAIAGGVYAVGLSVTNLPLLAMSLVALALSPVPFLGLALLPWVTNLVRMRANLERRLAARAGIAIARPYEPPPEFTIQNPNGVPPAPIFRTPHATGACRPR